MPAPFETITGEQLEKVLSQKPYRYGRAVFRVRELIRGHRSAINFAREYVIAQRHPQAGEHKLGVYDPETYQLICAFRLDRIH